MDILQFKSLNSDSSALGTPDQLTIGYSYFKMVAFAINSD